MPVSVRPRCDGSAWPAESPRRLSRCPTRCAWSARNVLIPHKMRPCAPPCLESSAQVACVRGQHVDAKSSTAAQPGRSRAAPRGLVVQPSGPGGSAVRTAGAGVTGARRSPSAIRHRCWAKAARSSAPPNAEEVARRAPRYSAIGSLPARGHAGTESSSRQSRTSSVDVVPAAAACRTSTPHSRCPGRVLMTKLVPTAHAPQCYNPSPAYAIPARSRPPHWSVRAEAFGTLSQRTCLHNRSPQAAFRRCRGCRGTEQSGDPVSGTATGGRRPAHSAADSRSDRRTASRAHTQPTAAAPRSPAVPRPTGPHGVAA
jgi:hypothetical protein